MRRPAHTVRPRTTNPMPGTSRRWSRAGARRIVMAFDPATDDPDLLPTVVMLLRPWPSPRRPRHEATQPPQG
jgi:hypothetical protein